MTTDPMDIEPTADQKATAGSKKEALTAASESATSKSSASSVKGKAGHATKSAPQAAAAAAAAAASINVLSSPITRVSKPAASTNVSSTQNAAPSSSGAYSVQSTKGGIHAAAGAGSTGITATNTINKDTNKGQSLSATSASSGLQSASSAAAVTTTPSTATTATRPVSLNWESYRQRLLGPDLAVGLEAAKELKQKNVEIIHTSEFPLYLSALLPAFASVLAHRTRPHDSINSIPHQFRNTVLTILHKFPCNEVLRPHAPYLVAVAMNILTRDYEENALLAGRILLDLYKIYRTLPPDNVQAYIDFVVTAYRTLPHAIRDACADTTSSSPSSSQAGSSSVSTVQVALLLLLVLLLLHHQLIQSVVQLLRAWLGHLLCLPATQILQ
jgi:hypothetical protein